MFTAESVIAKKLKTKWLLSPSFRDTYCNSYFVLFWEAKYFRIKVSEFGNGYIRKDALLYKVMYHNCTPEEVIQTDNQLILSFREPVHDLGIDPIVLVRISLKSF